MQASGTSSEQTWAASLEEATEDHRRECEASSDCPAGGNGETRAKPGLCVVSFHCWLTQNWLWPTSEALVSAWTVHPKECLRETPSLIPVVQERERFLFHQAASAAKKG